MLDGRQWSANPERLVYQIFNIVGLRVSQQQQQKRVGSRGRASPRVFNEYRQQFPSNDAMHTSLVFSSTMTLSSFLHPSEESDRQGQGVRRHQHLLVRHGDGVP
ncbi:hypothetical protein PAXRUDRAFT_832471 [Paxillus rubicundulus Ve08.2h10]|uniref:Uncharacterized protein n=1 Tax=Paxillus rubicundulus Ve08.2h10 TaxID=930991 RepID=A0A0D0DK18_9AGAM|nr:hypothetical protein PAXRUDRAFT_832471 [Paxillus rubicundulus Ve08.2h10]